MAAQSKHTGDGDSPLQQLREEFLEYLGAVGRQVVGKVTDKLTDVAEPGKLLAKAGGGDGDGGGLAGVASRAAQGENPVKAFAKEKAKGAKDKAVGKAKEAVGASGDRKPGDLKAINIIEHVDIGRPLRVVYNQFTQYEDFGSFMNGVSSVRKDEEDETKTSWKVRVWPSSRGYEATVQEQIPDKRIQWTSEGSKGTTQGAVSFHRLDENLTRVTVVCEYYPSGFVEKTGNIWRAQGRRLRLDLKHFQRYVTLKAEEVEGWRGEIRDGEVVRGHDEVVRQEEEEEREDREDQEPEEDFDEEGDGEGDEDDYEGEDENEDGREDEEYEADEGDEGDEEEEDEEEDHDDAR
ncbi:SRPBCC family protein [Streptomyces albus subsp. chlorinus]|uniref:SRPBCC family protein n=1 Tax=Streptomyces albus TaxID=1888 RepID=UPI00156FC546|nr:SRPBCC family protein [Streptomyces albus]NSC23830.1 SRPBCC family protein [Streptomyces albus subsp. chlorinus]